MKYKNNNIIVVIIIKENVNFCETFDILFICFVEFFTFVSFLEKEDWKEISKFDFEESLKEKFVCVVYFFAEFALSKNIHFDCESCNSVLIFFCCLCLNFLRLVLFFQFLKILHVKINRLCRSRHWERKNQRLKKNIVFIFYIDIHSFDSFTSNFEFFFVLHHFRRLFVFSIFAALMIS
jgi:hypothetical protein